MYVVLMNYADHDPLLSVPKIAYDDVNSTVKPDFDSGNKFCFMLSGRIRTSLGSGLPTLAINDVPSLKKGFPDGKTPHKTIATGIPDATRFFAVVEIPRDGRLDPWNFYIKSGEFNGQEHGCMPRSLSQTFPFPGPVTFFMDATDLAKTVIVKKDVTFAISNGSLKKGGHYMGYANFFEETIVTVHVPKDHSNDCQKYDASVPPVPICTEPQDLQVDCAPSQWP